MMNRFTPRAHATYHQPSLVRAFTCQHNKGLFYTVHDHRRCLARPPCRHSMIVVGLSLPCSKLGAWHASLRREMRFFIWSHCPCGEAADWFVPQSMSKSKNQTSLVWARSIASRMKTEGTRGSSDSILDIYIHTYILRRIYSAQKGTRLA